MKLSSRLFLALGAFLLVSLAIYAWHSHEYEGVLLSITVAVAALIFGGYGALVVRRTRASLTTSPTDREAATDESPDTVDRPAIEADMDLDEPHVGPTIWPLVFAMSAIGIVIGAVGNRWVLVPGGILFVAAAVGWVRDVHQQWHHHHAAAGLHATHVGARSDAEVADDGEAVPAVPRQTGSTARDSNEAPGRDSTTALAGGNGAAPVGGNATSSSGGDEATAVSDGAG
jgi:hypothetical protein